MKHALTHNTALGELRGLLSARQLPGQMVAGLEDQLEAMQEAKRAQEEPDNE